MNDVAEAAELGMTSLNAEVVFDRAIPAETVDGCDDEDVPVVVVVVVENDELAKALLLPSTSCAASASKSILEID